jgi:hypothetical protein
MCAVAKLIVLNIGFDAKIKMNNNNASRKVF